ncbi:hypothetical protein L7F22_028886 [Adiantum nelumboides]|nr:hypothetical protein [Adiantum nelumboides]
MRRVFPLRPAETSLLVTYENGTFEHENARTFEPHAPSAAGNLKHRRRSSTDFSVLESLPSSPRKLPPLQKRPPPSELPEFAEAASLSPRSSLWTCSFVDDGGSTSFNSSSEDTRGRSTSCISSSSSSSINFNPADSGSSASIVSSKDVEALLDSASSSREASSSHVHANDATCNELKASLRVKIRPPDAGSTAAKPSLKALAFAEPQELVQPETPTYVIPKKVEEYMQDCLDMPSNVLAARRSASTLKVSNRTHESSGRRMHLSRPVLESPRCFPSNPPQQRREAESNCSCTTPFKYLTKCLKKKEKRRTAPGKDDRGILQSPSFKFSTLTNGLYSPLPSPRSKPRPHKNSVGRTDRSNEDLADNSNVHDDIKTASVTTPRSLTPGRIQSKISNARSITDESLQSPSMCQSIGAAMVNGYVQQLQDEARLLSFHKSPRSISFHYDSESNLLGQPRRRFGSVDFTNEAVSFTEGANTGLSKLSWQRVNASSNKVSRQRPFSMDASARLGRDDSICSNTADNENLLLDCEESTDLFAAEEKNLQTLALLRLEINKLNKEKKFLARELAAQLNARQCQEESAENALKHLEAEMEEKLISVEKDHSYAQACLEQEMDRRKKEWSAKLDKIRVEEKRLRDRVTEMALERVELQKAIALHKSREASLQAQAKDHERSAQTWMRRHRQSEEEVTLLRKSFTHACNKLGDKEHELNLVLQRSRALEMENADLLKETARLKKAYADQEVTFEELWQRLVDIVNGPTDFKVESLRRLHAELKVFAVRERALRYEIDILQSQLMQTKQRAPLASENGSMMLLSSRMRSPKELRWSRYPTMKSPETAEDLMSKLEWTKQHTRRVEHQLEVKEEEMELLHSALEERDNVVHDLEDELSSVKAQRDSLRKQVQHMSQEAIRLTRDFAELKQVVENLDDELMLKEGEISILRDTCSEGDFLE